MTELVPASVVHFFDTRTRGILCGVRGPEYRSTKHSRAVTCHACVGLLGARRAPDGEGARSASADPGQGARRA